VRHKQVIAALAQSSVWADMQSTCGSFVLERKALMQQKKKIQSANMMTSDPTSNLCLFSGGRHQTTLFFSFFASPGETAGPRCRCRQALRFHEEIRSSFLISKLRVIGRRVGGWCGIDQARIGSSVGVCRCLDERMVGNGASEGRESGSCTTVGVCRWFAANCAGANPPHRGPARKHGTAEIISPWERDITYVNLRRGQDLAQGSATGESSNHGPCEEADDCGDNDGSDKHLGGCGSWVVSG